MMELKMWLVNFGLLTVLYFEPVFSKGFAVESGTAQWEDAMLACDSKDKILVPGRRYRVKALETAMADGDSVWLFGWRSVSDIVPDADNKLRTLKVDFSKPRKKPCAVVCKNDQSFFVAINKAVSVEESRTVCENEDGTLVDINTEADAVAATDAMPQDDPHWANSISASEASKIKQCLYARKDGSDVKYLYGDCKSEYKYICTAGKGDFSPLISLKIARFEEFKAVIDDFHASHPAQSSSSAFMETSSMELMGTMSYNTIETSLTTVKENTPLTVTDTAPVITDTISSSVMASVPAVMTKYESISPSKTIIHQSTETVNPMQSPSDSESLQTSPATISPNTEISTTMSSEPISSSDDLAVAFPEPMSTVSNTLLRSSFEELSSSATTGQSSAISPTTTMVLSPSATSKSVSDQDMSDLFAGVLIQPDSSSDMMPSYSSDVVTSSSSSETMTLIDNQEISIDFSDTKDMVTTSLSDYVATSSMMTQGTTVQEETLFHGTDEVSDDVITPTPSSSSSGTETDYYTEFANMNVQTSITFPSYKLVNVTESGIVNLIEYDDTDDVVDMFYTSLESSPESSTIEYTASISIVNVPEASLFPDQKAPMSSEYNQERVTMTSASSSIAFSVYDSFMNIPAVHVTDAFIEVIEPSSSYMSEYSSTSVVGVEPSYTYTHIVPTSSSISSEDTSDMETKYTATDDYDDIVQPSSSLDDSTSPSSIYPVDFIPDYPEVTIPYEETTSDSTDDIDTSIEDDLGTENEYEEGNASAGKSEPTEEGIEVGVWIAFGILIALVIVSFVLACFLYKRRKQQKSKTITPANGAVHAGAAGETVELRDSRSPSRENGTSKEAQGV